MEKSRDVSLATFFGDIITMTSKLTFSKVRFRNNSSENRNLAKSRSFTLPKSKINAAFTLNGFDD